MSDPNEYTVGWISALSTERVAAEAFLDERYPGPEFVSTHDNNDYTLGRIGRHKVAIAALPDGEYGLSSATGTARDMLHTFPNIRIGLMVGIGGGAPTSKHDIRLGDVVVSSGSHSNESGVLQYDFGKTIQDQSFQLTGFLNQPPTLLRTAISGLKAQYEVEGHGIEQAVNSVFDQKPRLRKKYSRPEPSTDRLFRSQVVHPPHEDMSCTSHCASNLESLVSRPDRKDDEDNPTIHYGVIASANQLMKDAIIRDKLSDEKNVMCFEMEAAGLMNHFPCLVIRGICDYSDSHKNKDWQGYAAMTAAAYAKDLLSRIAPNKIENEVKISDVISKVSSAIVRTEEKVEAMTSQLAHKSELEILNWLSSLNYYPQQSDNLERREPGTGQWLLDSVQYQDWRRGTQATLFCPGIPGAGKTIITSVVIDNLVQSRKNDPDIGIAYIYFNIQHKKQQTVSELLASLLKQLAQGLPSLPEVLRDMYRQHQSQGTRPSTDECVKAIQSLAGMYSQTFIVADALDEFQNSEGQRLKFLSDILKVQAKAATNLFLTSRFIPDVTEMFSENIWLEISAKDNDLHSYLENRISQLPSFVTPESPLWADIKNGILDTVKGMFLLAQLHFDALVGKVSIKSIRAYLRDISVRSDSYDNAYADAMCRIRGQLKDHTALAERTLLWITHAKRQLSVPEIREALAVEIGETIFDVENMSPINFIVSICAGLVTVDKASDTVRLVHHTAQEYFERTKEQWFPEAEEELTTACITYLSFDTFLHGPCNTDEEFESRLDTHRLYGYAAASWGYHAQACYRPIPQVHSFLGKDALIQAASQGLTVDRSISSWLPGYSSMYPENWTGLNLSAYFGFQNGVEIFTSRQESLDVEDSFGRTPFSWAAGNGHIDVVKILLSTGRINVDSKDFDLRTPLSWAAENGHTAVVNILLDTGQLDVESKDALGNTPLLWAAINNHDEVFKVLLDSYCTNHDPTDNEGRTPLSWASANGNETLVKLLLAKGKADVDYKDFFGRTPLFLATANNHHSITKILLETGRIDVRSKDTDGQTPLSWAAENGNDAVVRSLLDMGQVDVNSEDIEYGGTPLCSASRNGHEAVVNMLLEMENVDVDFKDNSGLTPLWLAAIHGHDAVVKLLSRSERVNVDVMGHFSQTPLSWAATNGHEALLKILLDSERVDFNFRDVRHGRTPLFWTCLNGQEAAVRSLLDISMVDVNLTDNLGQSPIFPAVENGHASIVKLLLEVPTVDLDLTDHLQRSVLFLATSCGHDSIIAMLLKAKSININAKSAIGQSALLWAAENGRENLVKLFLETDEVDVNLQDNVGRSPLFWATVNSHKSIVRMLLDKQGVDVNIKDNFGQSVLMWAAKHGPCATAKRIVNRSDDLEEGFEISTPFPSLASIHEAIIKEILGADGVDIHAIDHSGQSLVCLATKSRNEVVLNMLLRVQGIRSDSTDDLGRSPLWWAAECGYDNIAKLLLDVGKVVIDARDTALDATPFMIAVARGHGSMVRMLLDTGMVNVNARNGTGATPLIVAAQNGHADVVKILFNESMVDIDARDSAYDDMTTLMNAACYGHHEVVRLLVETGKANINAKTSNTMLTALSFAAAYGHDEIVKVLLVAEEDDCAVKARSDMAPILLAIGCGQETTVQLLLDSGKFYVGPETMDCQISALTTAAANGYTSVVDLLIHWGMIDLNSTDAQTGLTPILWAVENGNRHLVKVLLHTGRINVNCRDTFSGRTPLHIAVDRGYADIVAMLLVTGTVDINLRDEANRKPIEMPMAQRNDTIRDLLDEYRFDRYQLRDHYGQTETALATERDRQNIWKLPTRGD